MSRRRLPIGLQTFRKLRDQDCYYVDKTAYLERLVHEGKYYFLSCPRAAVVAVASDHPRGSTRSCRPR